jgi:membrane protein DedA with SNARE-associated domain
MLVLGGLGVPIFPEDGTFILFGFLTYGKIVKLFPGFLVVYVGALLADLMIYAVGRKYGRRIVTHRWFHRFLPPAKFDVLQEKFNRKGSLFILCGRHILGVRVQLFLVSGIMRMPFWKFLRVDGLTVILTIAIWAAVGYGGGHFLGSIDLHQSKIETFLLFLSKLKS